MTFETDAITFRGQDLYLRQASSLSPRTDYIHPSILHGHWTFTSPTIYLAHHPITAVFGYQRLGGYLMMGSPTTSLIRTAGIIALNSEDLYSIRPGSQNSQTRDGINYAQLVAKGKFDPSTDNRLKSPSGNGPIRFSGLAESCTG